MSRPPLLCEEGNTKGKELIMDYSCFSNMIFERRDPGILWITLSKPEKLNTADASMHQALADLWPMIDKDPETRVVVLTGSGRAFSAGGGLARIRTTRGHC